MAELKFLGTAGARFAVAKQIRYSAGIVLSTEKNNLIIDPGPGTLLRLAKAKPKVDIDKIDGIILSHSHLDHSSDANIILDSISQGGLRKKGVLITTKDAVYSENRVILPFILSNIQNYFIFEHSKEINIFDLSIIPFLHKHPVETYGFKILINGLILSFIVDTEFFPELLDYYSNSDVIVLNVVRLYKKEEIMHLSVEDAEEIIRVIRPTKAILTHFGLTMISGKPFEIAQRLSKSTGVNVVSAEDGLSLKLF